MPATPTPRPPLVAAGLLLAAAGLPGCGDGTPTASPEMLALGREVYHRPASCVTCHQEGGGGKGPLWPPLRENADFNEADPTKLIKIVSHGLQGEIEANGQTYNAPMAGLASRLNPEEIAAVLTFLRSTWGNDGPPVTVEQVKAVQAAHDGRTDLWTVAELEAADATPKEAAVAAEADDAADGPGPDDPLAWGEALYNGAAQCASCHQPDGLGVAGAYPPMAASPWVTGDAERLIKVALHGVGGEMEVLGEVYNAEMPGQGNLLDDGQMAATLTYVRQAWGNDASPVYADQVAAVRAAHPGRHEVWDAAELAKLDDRSPLENLRWRLLETPQDLDALDDPRFAELPVANAGTADDGYINLWKVDGLPDNKDPSASSVVFEAEFEVPAEDEYTYDVESTGGALVYVDDELVVGRAAFGGGFYRDAGKTLLSPGRHSLRLVWGGKGKWRQVRLSARANSVNRALWRLSQQPPEAMTLDDPSFLRVPPRDRPLVQRGRFDGQSQRGVAVGDPSRTNWMIDLYRGRVTKAWRGDFINAAGVWNGRNDKYLKPAGDRVLELGYRPPVARLVAEGDVWPGDPGTDAPAQELTPRGFTLVDGRPAVLSVINGALLQTRVEPVNDAPPGGPGLRQRLSLYAPDADDTRYLLLAEGGVITPQDDGTFLVDQTYAVSVEGPHPAEVRPAGDGAVLIAPAAGEPRPLELDAWAVRGSDLRPGETAFGVRYVVDLRWTDPPQPASAR